MPEIKIEVANEVFSLNCEDKNFFSRFINLHRDFLTYGKPSFIINFYNGNGNKNLFSVSIKQNNHNITVATNNQKQLERSFQTGCLQVSIERPLSLENYLRVILAQYLFHKGGFLLHASAIGYKNKAYIFTGPSGVGKSTIARISKNKLILSDDLVAIQKVNHGYMAFPTPFGLQSRNIADKKLFIAAVYLLRHSEKILCQRMSVKDTLARIISNIVFMGEITLPTDEILEKCYDFIKVVHCYDLAFNRDKNIWSYLVAS